jgi:hypothetical protein
MISPDAAISTIGLGRFSNSALLGDDRGWTRLGLMMAVDDCASAILLDDEDSIGVRLATKVEVASAQGCGCETASAR